MRLFQPCDRHASKADKYQEHGTPIMKLVPREVRDVLRALAKEEA